VSSGAVDGTAALLPPPPLRVTVLLQLRLQLTELALLPVV